MDNLEIGRRDNICILGGLRIQVTHPTYDFTAEFQGMTDIPSVYCFTVLL